MDDAADPRTTRCSDSDKPAKIKLIEAIQQKGKFWDALASQDAWEAARDPNNEDKRLKAARSVSIADHCRKQASEIVDLVHRFWPQDQ